MIVGEKFHSLNRNGKKQGCLTCPFPYTLLCAFGLFFIANVGEAAFQLCGKVRGLDGRMNWLARFFSEPGVQFLGRSSDKSALPMNRHSFRRPSLDNRNRFTKESCDLLPALQRLGRCFLCYAFGHIRRAWFASESESVRQATSTPRRRWQRG
jgi:hypothetical protein